MICTTAAELSWPQIGPSWLKVTKVSTKETPSWLHVSPMLGQVEPKLGPSWSQVGPCWPKLVSVAPHWPQVGPKMAKFVYVRGVHEGSAWRPWFSKMSTKALPQGFRRLLVRSDCSILLL